MLSISLVEPDLIGQYVIVIVGLGGHFRWT